MYSGSSDSESELPTSTIADWRDDPARAPCCGNVSLLSALLAMVRPIQAKSIERDSKSKCLRSCLPRVALAVLSKVPVCFYIQVTVMHVHAGCPAPCREVQDAAQEPERKPQGGRKKGQKSRYRGSNPESVDHSESKSPQR